MKLLTLIIQGIVLFFMVACTSEYTPSEIELSDKGTFVEKGTDNLLDGVFISEKNTGERLTVEFNDGVPDGEVVMLDENGETILNTNFEPRKTQNKNRGYGELFTHVLLSEGAGRLRMGDYLNWFGEFSEYDGEYLSIDGNNKKTIGHYDYGEKVKRWRVYCDNGQLESDRTFVKQSENEDKLLFFKVGTEIVNTCDGHVLLSAQRDKKGRLTGEYIENNLSKLYSSDEPDKLLPKYQRNYVEGELDGKQKVFDYYGLIHIENQFSKGVKQGVEKAYSSKMHSQSKEISHWLVEVSNYVDGQREAAYSHYDEKGRLVLSGNYGNDRPVGIWIEFNYSEYYKQLVDHDADNFIIAKSEAFRQACHFPKWRWSSIDWVDSRKKNLSNCEYYVENRVVDFNKKIALDQSQRFEKSADWTYPAIIATPSVYDYMKKHGLQTHVADSYGRTRLHICLEQMGIQSRSYPRCDVQQAIDYMDDVDINSISNIGTVLHQISTHRNRRYQENLKDELIVTKSLIDKGIDIDLLNHKKISSLMLALSNQRYDVAEMLLDAGASVVGMDVDGKSVLAHLFFNSNNSWIAFKRNTQVTRVLAKMVALGVDTNEVILDGKTVRDFSEEYNTIEYIQMLKEANSMSEKIKESLNLKAQQLRLNRKVKEEFKAQAPSSSEDSIKNELSVKESEVHSVGIESNTNNSQSDNVPVLNQKNTEQNIQAKSKEKKSENETDAQILLREQANFLVKTAKEHIANFRLKSPKGNNAIELMHQIKRIDPSNPEIIKLNQLIGDKYLELVSSKIKQGNKKTAQSHVNSAREFIHDQAVLGQYQEQVDNMVTKSNKKEKTHSSEDTPSKKNRRLKLVCKPSIKVKGIPMVAQTLIARQSVSIPKKEILSKSLPFIKRYYSNVKHQNNRITFETLTKSGLSVPIELSVKGKKSNTKLSMVTKTPAGVLVKKSDYRKGFCDLLAEF